MMWVGARDVEKEHYIESGGDFEREEPEYRAGFEAALSRQSRQVLRKNASPSFV